VSVAIDVKKHLIKFKVEGQWKLDTKAVFVDETLEWICKTRIYVKNINYRET
jgi:hypothetical protein